MGLLKQQGLDHLGGNDWTNQIYISDVKIVLYIYKLNPCEAKWHEQHFGQRVYHHLSPHQARIRSEHAKETIDIPKAWLNDNEYTWAWKCLKATFILICSNFAMWAFVFENHTWVEITLLWYEIWILILYLYLYLCLWILILYLYLFLYLKVHVCTEITSPWYESISAECESCKLISILMSVLHLQLYLFAQLLYHLTY